jgi:DNA-directed RNA polymerase subunit omega
MIYPSIDKLLNIVDSKYKLVHVVAQRARQMHETKHYQMKEKDYLSQKNLGRALEEVAESLVHIKEGN